MALDFNPVDERLLLAGYSSQKYSAIVLWQPENPLTPKLILFVRQELTTLKFFPIGKSLCAAGFQDGSVALYELDEDNLKIDNEGFAQPVMVSTNATGKHTSRVWDIQWVSGGQELSNQQQNDDGQKSGIQIGQSSQEVDTLVSVSTDGRVVERSLKRSFEHRDILTLVNLQPHPVALVQNNQKTQG